MGIAAASGAMSGPLPLAAQAAATPPVRFQAHDVAQQIAAGYQVIPVDMNNDRKLDLIGLGTAAKVDLNWYENPSWTPHLITNELTAMINAAPHDIDGDGIPEIAVQHGFSTAIKTSAGGVSLLTHRAGSPAGVGWTRRDIDSLPTSHRIRWMRADAKRTVLVNAPLLGIDATTIDAHAPNRLVYYEAPDWKRQVLGEVDGLIHGIHTTDQPPFGSAAAEALLSASFSGVVQHQWRGGKWAAAPLTGGSPLPWPKSGSSDVVVGRYGDTPILATLEPWHGNQVVVYRQERDTWTRQVIDETLTDAHALAIGDFAWHGRSAVVAGERQGQRSVYIFWPPAKPGEPWLKQVLDDGLNASSCVTADINSDGRIDIACIGSRQPSLKWYENLGS